MLNILNVHENIDYNIFLEIKENKIIRGHNFTLVERNKADWMLESLHFPEDHRSYVWNKLSTDSEQNVYMLLPSSVNKYVQE